MRHLRSTNALQALALLVLASCSRDPTERLAARYPGVAGNILASDGFVRTGDAYLPKAPTELAASVDPQAAVRGGLDLRLPADGAAQATFTTPGAVQVLVRERGAGGAASPVGAAIAYARSGGTSYWTATADGFEEWVEVEDASDVAVAEWEVAGAALRQAGDSVEVVDGTGAVVLRVTAPEAYLPGGAVARAWLRSQGQVIALFTDARGPALIDPSWTTTGSMSSARRYHTATLLPSGKVLVAGGNTAGTTATATAEVYDPSTGTWSTTGSMARARYQHTATLLPSGKVLVAGGTSGTAAVATAELYDPGTGTWTATGSLVAARQAHTATLLAGGRVLVAGGAGTSPLAGAEIYDPVAGTWAATGSLTASRQRHTATLLGDGRVLVAGGVGGLLGTTVLTSAELYDPGAGTWTTVAGRLVAARQSHAAVLLATGSVLFAGGLGTGSIVLGSAELWNPATGVWSTTGAMNRARQQFPAVLLPSGGVLVAGGFSNTTGGSRTQSELYDPSAGTWSAATALATGRGASTGTILASGRVLVAGGSSGTTVLSSSAVYDPTSVGAFSATGPLLAAREFHTATLLQSGRVLVAGGSSRGPPPTITAQATAQLYDPSAGTWSATGSLAAARTFHTATLLPGGKVLAAAGYDGANALGTAQLYDPAAGTWSTTGALAGPRYWHTATLLPGGKVLVAGGSAATSGGITPSSALRTAELYDPATGAWTATGSLVQTRYAHTATLLQSGKVLVVGGSDGTSTLRTAELYDPATGNWSATGVPVVARRYHSAVLLPSGKVLIAGGNSTGTTALATAELYDPAAGTFTATGSLALARYRAQAILLQSGVALMVGGTSGTAALSSAQQFDPVAGTWRSTSNNMTSARQGGSLTLLQSGDVLAAGGDAGTGPTLGCDLYDEGRNAVPGSVPTVAGAGSNVPGASIGVTGALFTGISEASGAGTSSSRTSYPLVELTALDTGAALFAPFSAFTSTSLTATLPATALPGAYLLRVVVNGVPSSSVPMTIFPPLTISPAVAAVPPLGSIAFGVSGGSGSGYTWSLATSASGGTINATTGAYVAGATGSVTDVVRVTDSLGNSTTRNVTVTARLAITPASASVYPRGTATFTATGGSGGYVFSLGTNGSGGTVAPATGAYLAGATGSTTDVVVVTDTLGSTATATVTVTAGVSISPSPATVPPRGSRLFTAAGGSGTGYTWSFATNASGGSLDTYAGAYTAGSTGGVTDVVRLTDSAGNVATVNVTVTAGLGIFPASASLPPRGSQPFTASGGSGAGFTWSLAINASGGSINVSTGAYQAGITGGVIDVVEVTDSLGNVATRNVTVTASLSISPATASSPPRGTLAFSASGGSGTGFTWSLSPNASGGTINAATGAYTAGPTGSVTDAVRVTDTLGNVATRSVTVGPGVSVSPALLSIAPKGTYPFTASGGNGSYTWSVAGTSGGSVNNSGRYTAGKNSGTDTLQVQDSIGNTATVTITVTQALVVTPAGVNLPPRGAQTFTASAGSGGGYVWSLPTNASGGSINPATGAYVAGPTPNAVDIVQVTDSNNATATAQVDVGAGVIVSPASPTPPPRGSVTFTASGGSGAYTWSLSTNASGGSIGSSTGAYVAGATGNVTDVVRATDSLGNAATQNVVVGAGVAIAAVPVISPRGSRTLTASGGSGTGWSWSLTTNASGGTISASTGAYVAGATGGVTDVVRVTDSLGNVGTLSVTVGPSISISPLTATLAPRKSQVFTAAGGSGGGWIWSLSTNASGGHIDVSTGAYVAGPTPNVTDVLHVTDSLGNTATRNVTVGPGAAISPASASLPPRGSQTFTASGGNGTGWTWSLSTNASGGSIDPASGAYVAGAVGNVTDVVAVSDSLGNSATRAVTVTAGVSISPASDVLRDGTTRTFTASGGSGTGWTWSLPTNASGGSIGSSTGFYQAGAADGVDVVRVTDSLGNAATATATVTRLFAGFAFDVRSAGQGATVLATLAVYNDTAGPVTVTFPSFAELALTALAPAPDVIDPSPTSLDPGASARFTYALTVTGSPGASYLAAATAQTSAGPTNLATTPAGTVAEVRVDWAPAAMVRERSGPPYRFSLQVTNDGTFPVTRVEIGNPQPASFTGLAADPTTCASADLPTATPGVGLLDFSGALLPGASTTLCFEFTGVPVVAQKTSYPFTVTVTRSGGSPPAVTYDRSVRLDVPPPDVSLPSVLSDATGQTLAWINSGTSDAPHDGVVVFRTAAPGVPTIPADYVDYRTSATGDTLYADAGYSTIASLADATVGVYNYRICNHDPDFVYSNCNSGFWNGQGWLDSAVAPPGGWTQQLGGAIYTLPGVLPGVSVSVATNAPAVFTLDVDAGDRSADPLALLSLPSRYTPVAPLASGRTLILAADSAGGVTAVDVATGVLAWQVAETGESFVAGITGALRQYAAAAFQASYAGDVLFVGSTSGRILALDADTGDSLWALDTGAHVRAAIRYDASNNWLYVPTDRGVLAYDLGTSSPTKAPAAVPGWINAGGSYTLGCIPGTLASDLACIDSSGVVRVLDKSTGAVRATLATGLTSPQTIWTVRSASLGFVVSNAARVQRLLLTGTVISLAGEWAPAGITLSPVQVFSGSGTIYVGGSDAALHKLSLADATDTGVTFSISPEAGAVQIGPPAYDVPNDLFLFGTDDGRLWAVKTF